ncbi:hypothetical protein N0V84_012400 [Fusarium piperis]|uniref:Probable glucan endo-1,3-beta-glucosidase eglC n=1 Tax=Fusarium piperis TaxID=1435070 RepID=A0A9W8VZU8_9HYPO|nr:hypothetical protein N0V84_012400 [Fusarium piperis]
MPSLSHLITLTGLASAAFQGFNYGTTLADGSAKTQADFEDEFRTAASLEGTDGAFTSARLYTTIQGGTSDDPVSAIPAAIKTKTSLLLGLWVSAGDAAFDNEMSALKKAADQYCSQLDHLVAGISVDSEDLYRNSPIGIKNKENPGVNPETLVNYISQTRKAVKGTCLETTPIGHVDTWTAYVNSSNKAVIDACDWLGMDAYPYYEDTKHNPVSEGANLFRAAKDKVTAVAGGREIWITETGWPISGKTSGEGVASISNTRTYWKDVGCPMFGRTNVWWYTLLDAGAQSSNPSFGLVGSRSTKKPMYDLSCGKKRGT